MRPSAEMQQRKQAEIVCMLSFIARKSNVKSVELLYISLLAIIPKQLTVNQSKLTYLNVKETMSLNSELFYSIDSKIDSI